MLDQRLLFNLTDTFRSGMTTSEATSVALKMLAWTKCSSDVSQNKNLSFANLLTLDQINLVKALRDIEAIPGVSGVAFTGIAQIAERYPNDFRRGIEICQKMKQAGVLETIDMADVGTLAVEQHRGDLCLPSEVADLMMRLSETSQNEIIYAPWDATLQFAGRATRQRSSAYIDVQADQSLCSAIAILQGGHPEIHNNDPIVNPTAVEGGRLRKFRVSISCPPFNSKYTTDVVGRDWYDRFPEKTGSGAVLAIRHLLAQTEKRIVVAVPNSLLFASGAEKSIRKYLIDNKMIKAIILLPVGILPSSGVSIVIMVIDLLEKSDVIRFINTDNNRYRERISKARTRLTSIDNVIDDIANHSDLTEAVCVPTAMIVENEYALQVSRYVVPDTTRRAIAYIAGVANKMTLDDIVSTVRPISAQPSSGYTLKLYEVGAACLPQYGYITQPDRTIKIDQCVLAKIEHQILRPYDIVIMLKGSAGKVGIIPKSVPAPGHGAWIAGQSSIVLRAKQLSSLDQRALFILLRSPLGQELISGIISGAAVPLIQLRELMKLEFPEPTFQECQQAISALEKEAEIQEVIDTIREAQAKACADLWCCV